jgi:hypothetical protein
MPKGKSVMKGRKRGPGKPKNESVALTLRVSPRMYRRVEWLRYARGITTQETLLAGLNLYFQKHNVPLIAPEPDGDRTAVPLGLDGVEEPIDLKAKRKREKDEREAASGSAGKATAGAEGQDSE